MSRPGAPAMDAEAAVEHYLATFTAHLAGSGRLHSGIAAELRSGLLDAMDAQQAAGLQRAEAAQAAIHEFGDPVQVASGFRPEIAARLARRVGVAVLGTGPLVGALWLATAAASRLSPDIQMAGLPLVAIAVGVTAWSAAVAIAATGRPTRWLPVRPSLAPTAAAVAGYSAVTADALGLVMLSVQASVSPGHLAVALAAAGAAASLVRILLARRAACRCLAIRATLA
jgi:hypothetical protein